MHNHRIVLEPTCPHSTDICTTLSHCALLPYLSFRAVLSNGTSSIALYVPSSLTFSSFSIFLYLLFYLSLAFTFTSPRLSPIYCLRSRSRQGEQGNDYPTYLMIDPPNFLIAGPKALQKVTFCLPLSTLDHVFCFTLR